MSKVEFRVGYYEWNIYINGKHFYTFNDGIGEDIHEDTTYSDLEIIIEEYINLMNLDLQTSDKEMLEDEELEAELKKQMIEQWSYHFGIEKVA